MWIMDLLQAGKQTENTQNTQNTQAAGREQSAAMLQKEIRALAPGQILSGQILEKSGAELKLLVNFQGSDLELQARLEQNMALSMGRNIHLAELAVETLNDIRRVHERPRKNSCKR